MEKSTGPLPNWMKNLVGVAGLLGVLVSLPLLAGYACSGLLNLGEGLEAAGVALWLCVVGVLTGGAGGLAAWLAYQSLSNKPSASLRLPPPWVWLPIFALCLGCGGLVIGGEVAPGLFFPPVLLVAAVAPPGLALGWFARRLPEGITWRRGGLAFIGGATVSVALAGGLEIFLPGLALTLVAGLRYLVLPDWEHLLEALAEGEVVGALTAPGSIFIFVQLLVVAPLVEELVKPLVTLPVLARLTRREAFWVAAIAGAGFAAVENMLYAGTGLSFWVWIGLVRALGCAIHPLGAGLMGLGWHELLARRAWSDPATWREWARYYGLAVGLHAVWNGGSVMLLALGGTQLFYGLSPAVNGLGVSMAGVTLLWLMGMGVMALEVGRRMARRLEEPAAPVMPVTPEAPEAPAAAEPAPLLSDRMLAGWALLCLVAIVPVGIVGLQLFRH